MGRDRIYAVIAAACTVAAAMLLLNLCLVMANAGTAAAYGEELPEAREAAWEPPAEPEPGPCAGEVDVAADVTLEEPTWEEPAYVETQYTEPTYVEPAHHEPEPTCYEPVCAETAYVEPTPAHEPAVDPSGVDLKTAGVVYDGGTRYTWYSERVLPGGGLTELNENGRAHDEAGRVVDADGYIAVASSDHEKGAVLDTPWGAAKVYDCGCDSGTVDIYTAW